MRMVRGTTLTNVAVLLPYEAASSVPFEQFEKFRLRTAKSFGDLRYMK